MAIKSSLTKLPFLFGAQYYRAPTPEPECWEADLRHMGEIGFNSVKLWAQWRWSHRQAERFVFDDLDRLMDLAQQNGLQVTINVVFDVSPHWLFEKYPDARQIMNNGRPVEPYTVGHRQIGGHPGPCYNHPGAREERHKFLAEVVERYRTHPALAMWDIWNEPELCFPQRNPDIERMVCYCEHCRRGFLDWLKVKYGALEKLNQVWGRCYEGWDEVELPRNPHTFTDYIDWREFHIATMTGEAAWRLEMVEKLDPRHIRYLHVVPNVMSVFNSVSCCADDFELARLCQVFAATMNGGPVYAPQVLSAARGKLCYNVESHIDFGSTATHQRILSLGDLLHDWLPQVGLGIRGFLLWQYRPEVLGFEAPAWGLVGLDGQDRPVTGALRRFWEKISPHVETLLACPPRPGEIGIWKSRKNEVFHFCAHGNLNPLIESVEGYIQALYWQNYAYRIIDGEMLAHSELDRVKLLIMPSPYYVTEEEAQALDRWLRAGGVLLCEAHLTGYNGTTGRHSRVLPGCGLAESWGLREADSTSSYHLKLETAQTFLGAASEDVRKALADFKTSGGQYFPLRLSNGGLAWGASRYAILTGDGLTIEGEFVPGSPCLVSKSVSQGQVFYCGTNLGQGAQVDSSGLVELLRRVAGRAGVHPILHLSASETGQVRVDAIQDESGPRFLVVQNRSDREQFVRLDLAKSGRGLFSGLDWSLNPDRKIGLPAGFIDLIVLG